MAVIRVTHQSGSNYLVRVDEGKSATEHRVTASPEMVSKIGGKATAEELIQASFEFLLEREPKESILRRFELTVIGKYFPEYRNEIRKFLA